MEGFSEFHKICTQMSKRLITPLMIQTRLEIITKILDTIIMARPIKCNKNCLQPLQTIKVNCIKKKRVSETYFTTP